MMKLEFLRKGFRVICWILLVGLTIFMSTDPAICAPQTLVVGMFTEPTRLDGRHNGAAAHFLPCLIEFLVVADHELKWRPQLATSWDISPDAMRVTYKLRKGVKYHCGYPFNAEAVKLNLDGALGRLEGWTKSTESGMIDVIDNVKILDEFTVEVNLKTPSAVFLAMSNTHSGVTSMICPSCLKKYGKDDFGIKYFCATGPFKFSGWVRSSTITFVKNEDYWDGPPKLDKVVYRIIKDGGARTMALEAGEIDLDMDVPSHELDRLKKNPKIQIQSTESTRTLYWFMNTKKGPTKDPKVRQAFGHAVNIPDIVKNVVGDTGVVASGCVASRVFGADKNLSKYIPNYDPQKAKQLLAEAGWKDSGDGTLRNNGKPLEVTMISMDHRTPKDREVAEAIQSYLKKIGVDCKMQIIEWAYFTTGLKNTSFDMYTYAWRVATGDCDYPFSALIRAGYHWNGTGYDNPKVQELISLGRKEPDRTKRLGIYFELQKTTLEDAVWVPMFHEIAIQGTQKYVKGYKPHPHGRPFFHKVYIDK